MNPSQDGWILHVDDQETSRALTRRMLARAGFEVTGVASGIECLQRVRENPALVLLDLELPDMSGFEVVRRLRRNPLTAAIPVLHLTAALVGPEHYVSALEGGADG